MVEDGLLLRSVEKVSDLVELVDDRTVQDLSRRLEVMIVLQFREVPEADVKIDHT